MISSGNLQMVDRSRINAEFSLDRDMGIDIRSRDFLGKNKMRYVLGVSTGNGLNNPSFTDFAMVFLARVEYLPLGIFRDMSEVDFARTKPRLAIGATYSFFDEANLNRGMFGLPFRDGGTADYHFVYADAMFKARGFSAITEFAFRTGTRKLGTITDMDPEYDPDLPVDPRNGLGWMLQAGYLVPNTRFEFSGRMALIQATRSPTSLEDSYAATGSVSWYFARHPFKIQADVSQIWEDRWSDGAPRPSGCNSRPRSSLYRFTPFVACCLLAACKPATGPQSARDVVVVNAKPRCEKLGVVEGAGGNAQHAQSGRPRTSFGARRNPRPTGAGASRPRRWDDDRSSLPPCSRAHLRTRCTRRPATVDSAPSRGRGGRRGLRP